MAQHNPSPSDRKVEAAYTHVRRLFDQGKSPDQARSILRGFGFDEAAAEEIVHRVRQANNLPRRPSLFGGGDPLMQIAGGVLFCLGIVLWVGNVSGLAPTMPYAGYVVGALGGAIFAAGSGVHLGARR